LNISYDDLLGLIVDPTVIPEGAANLTVIDVLDRFPLIGIDNVTLFDSATGQVVDLSAPALPNLPGLNVTADSTLADIADQLNVTSDELIDFLFPNGTNTTLNGTQITPDLTVAELIDLINFNNAVNNAVPSDPTPTVAPFNFTSALGNLTNITSLINGFFSPTDSTSIPTPSETGPIPSQTGSTPSETDPIPSQTGSTPSETGPISSQMGSTPSETGSPSSDLGLSPSDSVPVPSPSLKRQVGTPSSPPPPPPPAIDLTGLLNGFIPGTNISLATLNEGIGALLPTLFGEINSQLLPAIAPLVARLPTTGWAGYDAQRLEIWDHIESNAIEGVLFLSGSMQLGGLGKCNSGNRKGRGLYEIMVGPTGSAISALKDYVAILTLDSGQSQFEYLIDTWTYTKMEIDPLELTITVDFINDAGFPIKSSLLNFNTSISTNPCVAH